MRGRPASEPPFERPSHNSTILSISFILSEPTGGLLRRPERTAASAVAAATAALRPLHHFRIAHFVLRLVERPPVELVGILRRFGERLSCPLSGERQPAASLILPLFLLGRADANPLKAGFARNCLLAGRLLERSMRFVQSLDGAYAMGEGVGNWDGH